MNNLRLCSVGIMKLSVSAALVVGLAGEIKADTSYGPLRAGETLGGIVSQNYSKSSYEDSVIMKEILRMNPQAFIANDVGLIKQGVILTLPSDSTIRRSPQKYQTSQLAQSLETILTDVSNKRTQFERRIRRIESASTAQVERLSTTINRLKSDKEKLGQQLSTSSVKLDELRKSLTSLREDNNQLSANVEQLAIQGGDGSSLKQLEESRSLIIEKQQEIDRLKLSVSGLETEAEVLKKSHVAALSNLGTLNKTLEEKLAAQAPLGESADSTLKSQHALEFTALNAQHQKAIDDLTAKLGTQLAESQKIQTALKAEIKALGAINDTQAVQVAALRSDNSELNLAITEAKDAITLLSSKESVTKKSSVLDSSTLDASDVANVNPLLDHRPITKELLTQQLEKPVAVRLWVLLLGAFALGFTSLMMLFARRKRQVIPAAIATDSLIGVPQVKENKEDSLVFRVGDPEAQDPDIETLRVPPRIDPSRVAILDPAMKASEAAAPPPPNVQNDTKLVKTPSIGEHEVHEAKLKLLMAETYEELGDLAAANILLSEVAKEGNETQIAEAVSMITRLNHSE